MRFLFRKIAVSIRERRRSGRRFRAARPGADFFAFGVGEWAVDRFELVDLEFGHAGIIVSAFSIMLLRATNLWNWHKLLPFRQEEENL